MSPLVWSLGLLVLVEAASVVWPVPYALQMVVIATGVVFAGAHLSLIAWSESAIEAEGEGAALTRKDALLFPLIAAAALGTIFLALKFLDKAWVNLIVDVYIVVFGSASVGSVLALLAGYARSGVRLPTEAAAANEARIIFTVPFLGVKVGWLEIVCMALGAAITVSEMVTSHWLLNNAVAIGLSLSALTNLSVGRASTGALLMTGLFVYDIVMVFGTKMMQEVAFNIDAPIKVLLRNPAYGPDASPDVREFGALGLGDIVLPGAFIAFFLRFDALRAGLQTPYTLVDPAVAPTLAKMTSASSRFAKPHFYTQIAFYVAGLVLTVVVMEIFRHPQPALLYLVPAGLLSMVASATWRKEWGPLLEYSEEAEESEEEKKETKETKNEEAGGETKGEEKKEAKEEAVSNGNGAGEAMAEEVEEAAPSSGGGRRRRRE